MEHSISSPSIKKKLFFHFLWVLLVARIITGLTISSSLFDAGEWLSLETWIPALGFAVIWTVIYWTGQSRAKKNGLKHSRKTPPAE